MARLFSKKDAFCSVCNKHISHKHKPKSNWNVEGPLCADCYVDLMKKINEDKCVLCGSEPGSFNLWKPNKEWGIQGWLCKTCFDEKEKVDEETKKHCAICSGKLGFFCYSFKNESGITRQICKKCYNSQKENSKPK